MNEVTTIDKAESPMKKFDEDTLKGISSQVAEAGAPRAMFQPANMAEAMELAKLMSAGNFVPGHLRSKPGDCLAVIMQAARWGMDPFAVGNKTYFVNDRMAYEGQLVAAVVNSAKVLEGRLHLEWEGEGNDLVCIATGVVKGDPTPKVRRVPIKSITTRNSPLWKQDPEQQLGYYACRAWVRLFAPEVLLGVYTPDEIEYAAPLNRDIAVEPKKLTSEMLFDQAEQSGQADPEPQHEEIVVEAEVVEQEPASEQSKVAEQTLKDIDGPLEETKAEDPEPESEPATLEADKEPAEPTDEQKKSDYAAIQSRVTSAKSKDEVDRANKDFGQIKDRYNDDYQSAMAEMIHEAHERVGEGGQS